MDKLVRDIFLIIGSLVLMMLVWQMMFAGNSSILMTTYNAVATEINENWSRVNNQDTLILPIWTTNPPAPTDANNPTNYEIFKAPTFY